MAIINKNTLQMAWDLDAMAAYSVTNGDNIIIDLIEEGTLFAKGNGIRTIAGVKSRKIFSDISDNYTILQKTNGDISSVDYSGQTAISDVTIEVEELMVLERYKSGELKEKISQVLMRDGSDYSSEDVYKDALMSLKTKTLSRYTDLEFWQGSTTGATYNKFDGILSQLVDASTDNSPSSGLTVANAIAHVEAVVLNAYTINPNWYSTKIYMYMSPANFTVYYRALFGLGSAIDANTLNDNKRVNSFEIPGYDIVVIKTLGLEGLNNIVLTRENNFCVGTDLESENDKFDFSWLTEALFWRLMIVFKLGCKVVRTNEVFLTL